MDITKYYDPFLNYLKDIRKYSPQTVKTYTISLQMLKDNCEIIKEEEGYILNITSLRIKLKEHSKRSISTKLSAIRSFVKYIKNFHNIEIKLKGDQSVKVPKTLPKPIKSENILEVLNSCDLETALLIKILYGLGLRISELSNLKLENISQNWVRVAGKGNKIREIPIVSALSKDIQQHIQKNRNKVYLFEKTGKAPKDSQIRYKINRAFAKKGIKATPHQLRHAFATDLLSEGARIADVSELLGHSSMATTQIYTKLNSSTKLKNYLKAHPLADQNL